MYLVSALVIRKRNREKELTPRINFLTVIVVLINILLDIYNHSFYERYVHFLHALPAYAIGIGLGEKSSEGRNVDVITVFVAGSAAIGAFVLRRIIPTLTLSLTGIYKLGSSFLFVFAASYVLDKVKKVKFLDKLGGYPWSFI